MGNHWVFKYLKISCSFLQNPPGYPPQQQGYPPQSSVGAYPPQAYPGQQPYMTNAPIGGAQMMQPAYSAGYQQDPSKCAPPPAYTEWKGTGNDWMMKEWNWNGIK